MLLLRLTSEEGPEDMAVGASKKQGDAASQLRVVSRIWLVEPLRKATMSLSRPQSEDWFEDLDVEGWPEDLDVQALAALPGYLPPGSRGRNGLN